MDLQGCQDRINRYIMECKYRLMKKFYRLSMRINRYIMECKCYDEAKASMIDLELIDTLWNVNTAICKSV